MERNRNSPGDNPAPLVSVLLPVRNGERFLAEALNSLRAQTWHDVEIVAVNDGSTDGTAQILASYGVQDRRLRVISQPGLGLVAALNRGLAACRGTFIARMDADDIAMPQRLEKQATYLSAHSHVMALGSQVLVIDDHGRAPRRGHYPVGEDVCHRHLTVRGAPLCHPAVTFRADAVRAVGGYREDYRCAEDYDLWLRLARVGSIDNLPDMLLCRRLHDGNISVLMSERQAIGTALAYAANHALERGKADPMPKAGWPQDVVWPDIEDLFQCAETKALVSYVYFRTLVVNGGIADPQIMARFFDSLSRIITEAKLRDDRAGLTFMLTRAAVQLARHRHRRAAARLLFKAGQAAPLATLEELGLSIFQNFRKAS